MRVRGHDTFRSEREVIERQVQHMTRLVDDVMDVSRVATGRIEIRREPVDLVAVVENAVETVTQQIEQRGHRVHLDLGQASVIGDRVRLTQVVNNLLTNAARYTPQGGRIDISLE